MAKMTFVNEGVRGFYRGYACYMVAIMFWMSSLPIATEFFMKFDPSEFLSRKPKQEANQQPLGYDEDEFDDDMQIDFGFDDEEDE
jgi:hypothetical protein